MEWGRRKTDSISSSETSSQLSESAGPSTRSAGSNPAPAASPRSSRPGTKDRLVNATQSSSPYGQSPWTAPCGRHSVAFALTCPPDRPGVSPASIGPRALQAIAADRLVQRGLLNHRRPALRRETFCSHTSAIFVSPEQTGPTQLLHVRRLRHLVRGCRFRSRPTGCLLLAAGVAQAGLVEHLQVRTDHLSMRRHQQL